MVHFSIGNVPKRSLIDFSLLRKNGDFHAINSSGAPIDTMRRIGSPDWLHCRRIDDLKTIEAALSYDDSCLQVVLPSESVVEVSGRHLVAVNSPPLYAGLQ